MSKRSSWAVDVTAPTAPGATALVPEAIAELVLMQLPLELFEGTKLQLEQLRSSPTAPRAVGNCSNCFCSSCNCFRSSCSSTGRSYRTDIDSTTTGIIWKRISKWGSWGVSSKSLALRVWSSSAGAGHCGRERLTWYPPLEILAPTA